MRWAYSTNTEHHTGHAVDHISLADSALCIQRGCAVCILDQFAVCQAADWSTHGLDNSRGGQFTGHNNEFLKLQSSKFFYQTFRRVD